MNLSIRKLLPRSAIGLACFSIILLVLGPRGHAQASTSPEAAPATYSMDGNREPMVLLDGFWRFHPGDDSHWADPGFDDSQWPLIRSDKSWNEQGYPKLSGFAWYRAKLLIPEGENDLSLSIPQVLTSYQVYADGKFIGGYGGMPPHSYPITQFAPTTAYRLPLGAVGHARALVIAIRVWHWPGWESLLGGGISKGVRVGATALVENSIAADMHTESLNHASDLFVAILEALAGLGALAFFTLRPAETEYLWFFVAMFLSAGVYFDPTIYSHGHLDVRVHSLFLAILQPGVGFALIAFFFRLLKGRQGGLFWLAIVTASASLLVGIALPLSTLGWLYVGGLSLVQWNAVRVILGIPLTAWVLSLLFGQAVKGSFDARLLLTPVLLQQLALLTDSLLWFGHFMLGWRHESYAGFYTFSSSPFPFSVANVCDVLFLVSMLAIFVLRFTRTSRQEDAHQRELEAARTVQQVLIPEKIPDVPGFQIECVYLPAGQVGGDFFQVMTLADGGTLVVIGDVSGKGMAAAMTVSLLVGTVRTLAHFLHSPGQILAAMNQRMAGRSQGGFTTCLALHIDAQGVVTAANAGHLSPYRNGVEIAIECALPLGLAPECEYAETTFHLECGDQLTLLTDGVVEARNAVGEMFGFERAAAISATPAEEIARTAQSFGQEDDITVLAIIPTAKLEAVCA